MQINFPTGMPNFYEGFASPAYIDGNGWFWWTAMVNNEGAAIFKSRGLETVRVPLSWTPTNRMTLALQADGSLLAFNWNDDGAPPHINFVPGFFARVEISPVAIAVATDEVARTMAAAAQSDASLARDTANYALTRANYVKGLVDGVWVAMAQKVDGQWVRDTAWMISGERIKQWWNANTAYDRRELFDTIAARISRYVGARGATALPADSPTKVTPISEL